MIEEERPTGITDPDMLPDVNTAEAVRYGSAYRFHKNSQWIWSMIEDNLASRLSGLESQIMDTDFALDIMKNNRSIIRSPRPPFTARQNRDIFTLRDWARLKNTLDQIDRFRMKNEMWCRKQAIEEYITKLRESGRITPEDWKACNNRYNMEPITYDFVKGKAREQREEETIDWPTFVEAMFPSKEEPVPDIPDYVPEEPIPEPEEDDISPVQEYVRIWLEDPVLRALSCLEDRDESLNAAYNWLSESDFDPKPIIDRLLQLAEELP